MPSSSRGTSRAGARAFGLLFLAYYRPFLIAFQSVNTVAAAPGIISHVLRTRVQYFPITFAIVELR